MSHAEQWPYSKEHALTVYIYYYFTENLFWIFLFLRAISCEEFVSTIDIKRGYYDFSFMEINACLH